MEHTQFDGVFKQEFKQEDGILHRKLTQPSEGIILERNKQVRQNSALKDMSFGRQVASIPLNDYEMLCRQYPELIYGDASQRQNRLMKILSSVEGKKYMVQDKL